MNIKVNVTRKLVINGKEYGSPQEMPEELRKAYERAVGSDQGIPKLTNLKSKLVFQGKEYGTSAEMPQEVRKLYELAMAAATSEMSHPTGASTILHAKPAKLADAEHPRGISINVKFGKGALLGS